KERSWGMSSDYEIAIDCRSTMIRVGTAIFGPRVY
ncbi:MAG: YggS family pyridoxal phosphate-dependent enzyme, partial [Prevotella nigrescens]|nr:YggS family pyridoxal phosphate-dependent enzyme [Prevotella nigrescens]